MYEHTIGVPLVMAGPGIPAGRRSATQCYLRDLFPTLCELSGVPVPAGLDGRSLNPVLSGEVQELHPFVVGYFTDTQRMIRTDRWKYVRYPQANREQFFDLISDPNELRDLSTVADHAAVMTDLRRRLDTWLAEHDDPLLSK